MIFGVAWSLLAFEIGNYILFGVCLAHALRQGARSRERVALLLTGTVYGVLLETLTIYQLHAYYYGHFLVMFHNEVPLCIGVGWGIILYSSAAFADALRLNGAAWAAAVGLLGLNIDLTMDVVAVRLGMWNWHIREADGSIGLYGARDAWFGVPYGNFYAWFIVLTSAATLWRWIQPGSSAIVGAIIGKCVLVLLGSLTTLVLLDEFYVRYLQALPFAWLAVAAEIVGAGVVIALGSRRPTAIPRAPEALLGAPALAVPLFYHVYFVLMLACLAVDAALAPRQDLRAALPDQLPILLAIAGGMFAVSMGAHVWQRTVAARTAKAAYPVSVAP